MRWFVGDGGGLSLHLSLNLRQLGLHAQGAEQGGGVHDYLADVAGVPDEGARSVVTDCLSPQLLQKVTSHRCPLAICNISGIPFLLGNKVGFAPPIRSQMDAT